MFPTHMKAVMAITTLFLSQMAKLEISMSTHLKGASPHQAWKCRN
jgi:hypothetical protein